MAQEKIIIKFEAKGHKPLIAALDKLAEAQKRATSGSATYSKQAGILDTRNKRNAKSASSLGLAFSTLRSKLLLASFAMAMFIKPLMRFGKEAAKVESMGRAFNTLSGGTQRASVAMGKLQKATNGTMTEMDLLKQANSAMILGVTKSSDEMAEMFDIAQRLGRALGQDTASSVESLITGIGRQSRLMLDNIGIIVKADEAYESYAEKLGISADKLTDADKKQAFFTATMESARSKVASLGRETLTSEDSFQQFGVAMSEFGTTIGEVILPHLTDLLDFTTKVVKGWKEFFDVVDLKRAGEEMQDYVKSFKGSEEAIEKQIELLRAEREIILKTLNSRNQSNKMTKKGTQAILDNNGATMQIVGVVGAANDELSALAQVLGKDVSPELAKVAAAFYEGKVGLDALLIAWENNKNASNEFADNLAPVDTGIADLTAKIVELQKELARLREGTDEVSGGFAKFWEDNQEGAQLLVSGFSDMTSALQGNLDARMKSELDTLKASDKYRRADSDSQKKMEADKMASFKQERLKLWKFEKASNLAEAGINIATAITKAMADTGILAPILVPAIAAMGAVQIGAILGTKPPKFAQGGMIGGRRHSQGGTMIEAEQGEFVMSRSAVESLGIENLNRMNQGGGGAVTVNVSGNVLSQDFVEGELAENIKEAVRRGTDFGIS